MKVKVQILKIEEFNKKVGVGHQAACLDISDGEHTLINTFDYTLSEADMEKLAAEKAGSWKDLKNKRLVLGLDSIEEGFGKRLRTRGAIVEIMK